MLKMLKFFEFWSKIDFFYFWTKFRSQALAALGKRVYQKIWWGLKSIVSKLFDGVFNLLIGLIPAEKIGVKVLTYKKRRFLYKKSSHKCGVRDMISNI